ncbi:LysR family transcriptional regulator [Phyllobacterium myrsinacearum]|uniref:DNA-binding transcriptional LysR family regulator n=1 Tax=Phyllobacterium myrsinacearum TaxID=28101 RepID=A0A839EWZ5_9HYPH|nr:LysR family transcriptional regulator [Phyllobacterium myrsinacearum]MBA8880917.1 DNA-binding transcriptional LysR family regulator [Phyllobacterium myrsinacearum]
MGVSLDRLTAFRAVVETRSFTGAAKQLNQARAAVSFNVKQLEIELGVTLLHRTTRSLALTDAGERFYARALRILTEAEEAIAEARAEQTVLSGSLRLTSTVEYGVAVIAPALQKFTTLHPDLDVQFEAYATNVDLLRDRFDVAIRLGRNEQFQITPYVGIHLGTYQLRPVASPSIIAGLAAGAVGTPEMLSALPFISNATVAHVKSWTMFDPDGGECAIELSRHSRLLANNASVVKALASAGAGVALLPDWFVKQELADGTLVDALPSYRLPDQQIYAMHLPMPTVPQKIKAWLRFLKDHVRR